jgi:hypothetical protein
VKDFELWSLRERRILTLTDLPCTNGSTDSIIHLSLFLHEADQTLPLRELTILDVWRRSSAFKGRVKYDVGHTGTGWCLLFSEVPVADSPLLPFVLCRPMPD